MCSFHSVPLFSGVMPDSFSFPTSLCSLRSLRSILFGLLQILRGSLRRVPLERAPALVHLPVVKHNGIPLRAARPGSQNNRNRPLPNELFHPQTLPISAPAIVIYRRRE